MKKNSELIFVSLMGLFLIALCLCIKCNEKVHENESVIMEDDEVIMPQIRNVVRGYRRKNVIVPVVPEEIPTDEGFLSIEANDSIELCTDIMSGHPYRIIIESGRQNPLCKLFNENGDSIQWNYATQAIRFSDDSLCLARLMVANDMFPFGISEDIDSIPEMQFCDISLAEFTNTTLDSIHSLVTRFPIFGCATILFCTASEQSDKLYLKVVHPGLLSVAVVYDETVCGYPLFWDNESDMFKNGKQHDLLGVYDSSSDTLLTDF